MHRVTVRRRGVWMKAVRQTFDLIVCGCSRFCKSALVRIPGVVIGIARVSGLSM